MGEKNEKKKNGKHITLSGFHLAFLNGEETGFLGGKQMLGLPKIMTNASEKVMVVFLRLPWNELKIEADVGSSRAFIAC